MASTTDERVRRVWASADKGCFGKNRIFFPDVPHRSRHVPGVIKHGPEVLFTRSDVYSHLRPNSFTPFLISQRERGGIGYFDNWGSAEALGGLRKHVP